MVALADVSRATRDLARQRIWVGCKGGKRVVFLFPDTPTAETHGDRFAAVIGPFRTRKAADLMAGNPGPQIQTVADAERYA